MAQIPLEDFFQDVLGKAQRGLKLTDEQLAARAGISVAELTAVKSGTVNEPVLRKLAPVLGLNANALVAHARQAWYPRPVQLDGLAQFNTPYEDMTVNAYLVWNPRTKQACAFDTGAVSGPMRTFAAEHGLTIRLIFLTHTHGDHIADLERLREETGAPVFVSELEPVEHAERFREGRTWDDGAGLHIEARSTTGHSKGGTTYYITGLAQPVAIVGDAIFASSMGGGIVSYTDALHNNRSKILTLPDNTVICPGHGPLTTVGEEKQHNPFFAT
jgi:glyoxylase-like metal-dependent hydrolase (beta-lactamase superfamily II)